MHNRIRSLSVVVALAGATALPARAAPQRLRDVGIAELNPASDHSARGLVQITVSSAGRPTATAVGTGLRADTTVRVALARAACGELIAGSGETVEAGTLTAGADGEIAGGTRLGVPASALRTARSLALMVTDGPDGDVLACGRLGRYRALRRPTRGSGPLLTSHKLTGRQRLHTYLFRPRNKRAARGRAILIGLEPKTRYAIAVSRRSCGDTATHEDGVPYGFTTDAAGTASVSLQRVIPARTLSSGRSVVALKPIDGRELEQVLCAPARVTHDTEFEYWARGVS